MDKIYFDTETTGLAPGQIAQLAYIKVSDSNEVTCGNYFFTVDYMSTGAEDVTGRSQNDYAELSGGTKFRDKADELFNIFSNSTLVAHNIQFDENFLSTEFWRVNKVFKPADRFDTMKYFKSICKIPNPRNFNEYKNPKLVEVIQSLSIDENKIEVYTEKLFGIATNGFHDAMYDTTSLFVMCQVYGEMSKNIQGAWTNMFHKGA